MPKSGAHIEREKTPADQQTRGVKIFRLQLNHPGIRQVFFSSFLVPNKMSTNQPKSVKSPVKSCYQRLGYFFGEPLESFDHLLQVTASTSTNSDKIKPSDLDIIRHFIYLKDQNKTSTIQYVTGLLTDNLIEFWATHHSSKELR